MLVGAGAVLAVGGPLPNRNATDEAQPVPTNDLDRGLWLAAEGHHLPPRGGSDDQHEDDRDARRRSAFIHASTRPALKSRKSRTPSPTRTQSSATTALPKAPSSTSPRRESQRMIN